MDALAQLGPVMPQLLRGFLATLELAAVALVLGTAGGVVLGCLYAWGGKLLRALLFALLTLVRGIPLVVQVFAVFFVLPVYGIKFSAMASAAIALTGFAALTTMEVVRGGIAAVPREQFQAARSLGFPFTTALTTVVLPQALRIMTPALVNQAVFLVKATSVVSLFGVTEFMFTAKEQIERTLLGFEIMAIVWIVYTVVCYPMTLLGRRIESRLKARGHAALAGP
ncbi:MAG: amino acid ABC transporter permease [Alphaproteobacteria bacterium]|nr:amino acid ABC transporter permease [Alphaproteobacteria bacterium]